MSRPDKAHTAGRVVKRCVTRVVDGDLQVKSPSVMMGYVNAPELTRQILTEDGRLCTGDIGYEDEDGFIHITGRKKSLIILSNGANVSPEQIENLLLDHQLIKEALVYGEGSAIVAEIYPDSQYAALHSIRSIPAEIERIVQNVNRELPSYKRIMKHLIRTVPFQRTGSNKIVRSQRADRSMILNPDAVSERKPENETQQMIFDCVAQVLGHRDFGIDTNLFAAGLDSLGCILLLSAFSEDLKFTLELDEFMALSTVEKLSNRYHEKSLWDAVDHSVRPVYGMSGVQTLFAYVMRGNTTSNIPFLFKLDPSVDLERMKRAVEGLFPIHPILNDVVQMLTEKALPDLRKALPAHLFPAAGAPHVLDRNGHIQPIGGWGTLVSDGKAGTARILPDGTVDHLEDSGRSVMLSTVIGRVFPNLQKIEDILNACPGVESAEAFTCYWKDNNMHLCADISGAEELTEEALRAYLAEHLEA